MSTGPATDRAAVETNGASEPHYSEQRRNPRAPLVVTLQLCVQVPGTPEPVSFRGATRSISSAGATIVLSDCPREVFETLSQDQILQLQPMFTGPLEAVVNGSWVEDPDDPETQTPRLCLSLTLQNATWFPAADGEDLSASSE